MATTSMFRPGCYQIWRLFVVRQSKFTDPVMMECHQEYSHIFLLRALLFRTEVWKLTNIYYQKKGTPYYVTGQLIP